MRQELELINSLESINQDLDKRIESNIKMYINQEITLRELIQDYNEISSLIEGIDRRVPPELLIGIKISLSRYRGLIEGIQARMKLQKNIYREFDNNLNREN